MSDNLNDEHFAQLIRDAMHDNTDAVLRGVDLYPSLVNRLKGRSTLLRWAVINGNYEMTEGLLIRGAKIQIDDLWNELIDACINGSFFIVRLLLDYGADPCSGSDDFTALGFAAQQGNYNVCSLLIARGANLMAIHKGSNILAIYGITSTLHPDYPPFVSFETQKARLMNQWRMGPHPSQVQRRADEIWARRWPLMQVLVGHDFLPLAVRRAILAAAALPPSVSIPPLDISTTEKLRAYLIGIVFGNPDIVKRIGKFL
jgi:hypothetical protein